MPILSVLIPSRMRPVALYGVILSFMRAMDNPSNVEFLLRFDADDHSSMYRIRDFEKLGNVTVKSGPRLAGWGSYHTFINELLPLVKSPWVCFFSDDTWVQGNSIDSKLMEIPKDEYLCTAETTHFASTAQSHLVGCGAYYFLPNKSWEKLGWKEIGACCDTGVDELYRKANWSYRFLEGVEFVHCRDDERIIILKQTL